MPDDVVRRVRLVNGHGIKLEEVDSGGIHVPVEELFAVVYVGVEVWKSATFSSEFLSRPPRRLLVVASFTSG